MEPTIHIREPKRRLSWDHRYGGTDHVFLTSRLETKYKLGFTEYGANTPASIDKHRVVPASYIVESGSVQLWRKPRWPIGCLYKAFMYLSG
jgi:hypothetical protein